MNKKMRTFYIRELSYHTPASLAQTLRMSIEDTMSYIDKLCAHGILRLRTNNDTKDYDNLHDIYVQGSYQFNYVGLVLFDSLCIVVYPKFLPEIVDDEQKDVVIDAMRQVFRVLRKHSGKYSDVASMAEEGLRANERLTIMLRLLEMFDEYGIYSNYVRSIADNGYGDIEWNRTIAQNLPFMQNNRPIYMNYKTVETSQDTGDFVMRLHRTVLTESSKFMQQSGLSSLLALDDVFLTDANMDEFGDMESISYRLRREQSTQFVTWKQHVIDLLLRYIDDDSTIVEWNTPLCLGTTSFYHIWEEACKAAFNDMLDTKLGDLGIELVKPFDMLKDYRLLDIIPRPIWSSINFDIESKCGDVETLIPDTILINHDESGNSVFAILDAKYYTPILGKSVSGVPGVESIIKQFLYQSSYHDFLIAHKFSRVVNAFLIPSADIHADTSIEIIGFVSFPGLFQEKPPCSNNILLCKIRSEAVFDAYLTGKPFDSAIIETITTYKNANHP